MVLRDEGHIFVLQVVFTASFMNYLPGGATYCKCIQPVDIMVRHFCHLKSSQLFCLIAVLSLQFTFIRHGRCTHLCFESFCCIL